MAAIYILSGYQNYFNRQIKEPKELVAAYPQDLISYYDTGNVTQVINFNPADGVIAHHTVGRPENPYDGSGDYFLWSEDGINVTSRWFIIESTRTRQGQYNVTLKRDVIADNYNEVLNSDCFIQKATVSNESNLIYNQEPITTNQILTSSEPLKDKTKMGWICGFVDQGQNFETPTIDFDAEYVADETYDSISDYPYNKYAGSAINPYLFNPTVHFYTKVIGDSSYYRVSIGPLGALNIQTTVKKVSVFPGSFPIDFQVDNINNFKTYITSKASEIREAIKKKNANNQHYLSAYINQSSSPLAEITYTEYTNINLQKDITLYITGEQKYYKVNVKQNYSDSEHVIEYDVENSGYCETALKDIARGYTGTHNGSNPVVSSNIVWEYPHITYTELATVPEERKVRIVLPQPDARMTNRTAPFDMFCIPYSDEKLTIQIDVSDNVVSSDTYSFIPNKSKAMALASQIGSKQTAYVYDIQLLPYCPLSDYKVENNKLIITTKGKGITVAKYLKDNGDFAGQYYYLFWCNTSSGTFNITKQLSTNNLKMCNQVDMYRLVSPTYSGQFEFNLARNEGTVNVFNVDYTYLPGSSYIHVNFDYKGLYGYDDNSPRGLVCQGQQSIMYTKNAWAEYSAMNTNLELMFNREIQNINVNRKYQRMGETISAWTGAIGAGGGIGGLIGGVAGGVAGGIAGGASLAAGYADRAISDKLYQESVSFKKDMHEMQLENIKALPNSIAKSTAYTENNPIFPVLEYYTCTTEEKDLVAKAIANMGMTVNAVGKPIDYVYNTWNYNGIVSKGFFKATLIRLEDLPEDYHMLQAIAEELSLGIYFKGE